MESFIVCILVVCAHFSLADESTHTYKENENVLLWVNKIGPNRNPQETYTYNSLPWCTPKEKNKISHKFDGIGSLLEGNELVDSGIAIKFKENREMKHICDITMDEKAIDAFSYAVENHYWYQMYLDELPLWGLIGEMMVQEQDDGQEKNSFHEERPYMYTHRKFIVTYNDNHIIHVNITSDNLLLIEPDKPIPMTLELKWKPTANLFKDRFSNYLDVDFFEHQIHWFSIFNSFMMVLFLCGLVVLILLRTLRNDYVKYTLDDDGLDIDNVGDESGWKQVHGDVFRAPLDLTAFCAIIGTGHHLFAMGFVWAFFAITGSLYSWRGGASTTIMTSYVLTSFVGGYSSSSYYKRCGGRQWKKAFCFTVLLLPGICAVFNGILNIIALSYASSAAIPFLSILGVFLLWLFVGVPLMLVGTIVGRNTTRAGDFPCRVSTLRRPIPIPKWYLQWSVLSMLGGILPFGSIFIEMHFIFTSFWNYKFYYVYGFLLLVYVILTIVTVCVTIVSTYFLLNAEDYRWQWMSLCSGASTAIYVFLYSVYYFFSKTHMSGFLQTCFYFGYMSLVSISIACLCGAMGFIGAHIFVSRIYKDIKSD